MFELNLYQQALVLGVCILIVSIAAYFITWVGQWCYAWLDDSKTGKDNLIILKLSKLFGYEDASLQSHYHSSWRYRSTSNPKVVTDGEAFFFVPATTLAFVPLAIVIFLDFLCFSLTVAGLVLMAHLARMCFRHKKLFNKHVNDTGAHKGE